jgi:hypothetical protein
MDKYVEIFALVEGPTEKIFIQKELAPYLALKNIGMVPIIISNPGEKGGDVRFERVMRDIGNHLKQRADTFLTLFIDFYGIKGKWPGLAEAKRQRNAVTKADCFNRATKYEVVKKYESNNASGRFIPYVNMHEFETLLFSDPDVLSRKLNVQRRKIEDILRNCGNNPEDINDSPSTCPSKRLIRMAANYKKTVTGISVLNEIGIESIRATCKLFDGWLTEMESLVSQ